jgi:hypothetical protein
LAKKQRSTAFDSNIFLLRAKAKANGATGKGKGSPETF